MCGSGHSGILYNAHSTSWLWLSYLDDASSPSLDDVMLGEEESLRELGSVSHLGPEHSVSRCKVLAPGSSQARAALTLTSASPIIKTCLHHFGPVT